MTKDAQEWASSGALNDIAAIAAVPRSGLLPASVIALHSNTHLVQLESLQGEVSASRLRRGDKELPNGPVLVLDDTARSGRTLSALKAKIGRKTACGRDLIYAALYVRESCIRSVDRYGYVIPMSSVFAWNWRHVKEMSHYMLDMDGVLFPDAAEANENPSPIFRPTYPVRAIVTGRGEHLREHTERWLSEHEIKFYSLHMMPSSPVERDGLGGPAGFKALKYARDPEARLFVESDVGQAKAISTASGKPVLCTQNWELYG